MARSGYQDDGDDDDLSIEEQDTNSADDDDLSIVTSDVEDDLGGGESDCIEEDDLDGDIDDELAPVAAVPVSAPARPEPVPLPVSSQVGELRVNTLAAPTLPAQSMTPRLDMSSSALSTLPVLSASSTVLVMRPASARPSLSMSCSSSASAASSSSSSSTPSALPERKRKRPAPKPTTVRKKKKKNGAGQQPETMATATTVESASSSRHEEEDKTTGSSSASSSSASSNIVVTHGTRRDPSLRLPIAHVTVPTLWEQLKMGRLYLLWRKITHRSGTAMVYQWVPKPKMRPKAQQRHDEAMSSVARLFNACRPPPPTDAAAAGPRGAPESAQCPLNAMVHAAREHDFNDYCFRGMAIGFQSGSRMATITARKVVMLPSAAVIFLRLPNEDTPSYVRRVLTDEGFMALPKHIDPVIKYIEDPSRRTWTGMQRAVKRTVKMAQDAAEHKLNKKTTQLARRQLQDLAQTMPLDEGQKKALQEAIDRLVGKGTAVAQSAG